MKQEMEKNKIANGHYRKKGKLNQPIGKSSKNNSKEEEKKSALHYM